MRITKAEFIKSGTNKSHMLDGGKPEFMFCGRSNVGKSSFINALCNRKNLAKTSSKPGKTITLNMFNINDLLVLVDVPGYGEKLPAVPLSRGEMDEPVVGNLVIIMSLDQVYHSVNFYTKLKENTF